MSETRTHGIIRLSHKQFITTLMTHKYPNQGMCVEPVFSLCTSLGPVFRVMVRVTRGAWPVEHYAFIGHCFACGHGQVVGWRDLGGGCCGQCGKKVALTGPCWTGPLHDGAMIRCTSML